MFLENFKIGQHGNVIRTGNAKIVLLFSGHPLAAIFHATLIIKKTESEQMLAHIEEFKNTYKWAWQQSIENSNLINNIEININ